MLTQISAIVEQLPREQRLGRLARSVCLRCSLTIVKGLLDLVPKDLGHDWHMLALVDLALMGNQSDINRI